MELLPCRTSSFAGLVSKLGKNKEMAQPCCVLPVARLIAARNPRMGIYLTCKSPEVRCLNVGLLFRSISTSSVVGKLVSRDSSCRHVCRISSSDMTSQLELAKQNHAKRVNGIFWILLLNLGLYVADHWFLIREVKALYLYHARPTWFQFLTATFCHANWNHLSSNLFFLYIFGKLVEEEEGNLALWISYILTGAGANLVSWLVLPRNAVSVGASGAVFGLFAISVLVKIRWDWRKILEVLILGQFVIQRVMEAAQASAGMSGTFGGSLQNVNHIAHLSGALIGVVLIWLVSSIPSSDQEKSKKTEI